jgi:hypothetical protein
MQASSRRERLLERRHHGGDQTTLWDKLSLAQKFAATNLTQLGYDLSFIRNSNTDSLAILQCDDNTATITGEGEINTSPIITIRP